MTELVAPFVPVHGSWTFLPDMNCLLDPSGRSIRLSVNYRVCVCLCNMFDELDVGHNVGIVAREL